MAQTVKNLHAMQETRIERDTCTPMFIASLVAQMIKNLPAVQETWLQSLGLEDPLEKGMATHSSILAWRIPWTKEFGELQSMAGTFQARILEWVAISSFRGSSQPRD